ncbi:MAG: hypothetical protein AAGD13_13975 [Pseudomonadota bacterium]
MRGGLLLPVLVAAALSLSACGGDDEEPQASTGGGTFIGDIGTLWGEESSKERAERLARLERASIKVPISSVKSVELGRTRDGFLVTAFGTAPSLGYSLPVLRPRRNGEPGIDGYIEYDFVATEPAPGFQRPPGTTQTRALRADLAVRLAELRGANGLRVLALNGGVQMDF